MYKVLVVDDEPIILEGLMQIINWGELDLEIAAQAVNGAEASQILEENKINILITDIKMPEMNGLELIKHIRTKNLNIKIIILSGYDDFEYVKEAAKLGIENYLLKPVDTCELVPTLRNAVDKIEGELYKQIETRQGINILKDNILNRWITGNITETELTERSSLLELKTDYTIMAIAYVKIIYETIKGKFDKIQDRNLMSFAVNNICSQILAEYSAGFCFQDLNGDIAIIFTSNHDIDKEFQKFVLNKCIRAINELLKLNVFVTVGGKINYHLDLYKSYEQAVNLQEYSLFLPVNHIVHNDDTGNSRGKEEKENEYDYNLLKYHISEKNLKACSMFISNVFSELCNSQSITPSFIHNITLEMLFNIITTVKNLKPNSDEYLNKYKDIFSEVYKIKKIDELIDWLTGITETCIDYLNVEDQKMSPIIKKVLIYIDSNYSKDINLKTISSEFDLNPIYLGQLFKNETGFIFTNYLNVLRIEKAKELLLNSNLKLNDISQKVGYFYTNYFCSVFRKITGVSPSEYKG